MRAAGLLLFPAAAVATVASPLAHSHNDYEQRRPLLDALALGFNGAEADIRLVDGRLRRFWNTPNRPGVWRVLREAGVDVIGTDDLLALRRFLATP